MSADNYLAVRHDGVDWTVNHGNASTGDESVESHHKTREEAIDKAEDILSEEYIEYGLSVIEKLPRKGKELDEIISDHLQEIKAGHDGKLKKKLESFVQQARIDELEGLPVSGLITMGGVRQDVITELEVSRRIKELKEKP